MAKKRKARKKGHITRAQRRAISEAFGKAVDQAGGKRIGFKKYDMEAAVEKERKKANGESGTEER